MAVIQPVFDSVFIGSGTTSTKDDWFDISGAIDSGTQLWLGYATFVSNDKQLTFELRPNLINESLGQAAKTQLRAFTSVPTGESRDVDLYLGGAVQALAPKIAPSTGVEKLWLRVRSGTQTISTFDYIIYYSVY